MYIYIYICVCAFACVFYLAFSHGRKVYHSKKHQSQSSSYNESFDDKSTLPRLPWKTKPWRQLAADTPLSVEEAQVFATWVAEDLYSPWAYCVRVRWL